MWRSHKAEIIVVLSAMTVLAGCQSTAYTSTEFRNREAEEMELDFEEVVRGNLNASIQVTLMGEESGDDFYYPDHEEMTVKEMNLYVGQFVHKGDVLVTFDSGDVMEDMKKAMNRIKEDNILLEHVQGMKQIYPSSDYSAEEGRLLRDIDVQNMSIEEYKAWADSYTIYAKNDGIVTMVNNAGMDVKVGTGYCLVKVGRKTDRYRGTTSEPYDFSVGSVYSALAGVATKKLILDEVKRNGDEQELSLHVQDGETVSSERIILIVPKEQLTDVLYVKKSSVRILEDKAFLFVLNEKGNPVMRQVETGDTVREFIVIKNGVTEGEKVVKEF